MDIDPLAGAGLQPLAVDHILGGGRYAAARIAKAAGGAAAPPPGVHQQSASQHFSAYYSCLRGSPRTWDRTMGSWGLVWRRVGGGGLLDRVVELVF